ncbi:MAG: hypothetical protein IPK76_19525 [Lewinellaceae bacterium]|nr:hypothetical protein [Lewinellaceae bacterium]
MQIFWSATTNCSKTRLYGHTVNYVTGFYTSFRPFTPTETISTKISQIYVRTAPDMHSHRYQRRALGDFVAYRTVSTATSPLVGRVAAAWAVSHHLDVLCSGI